MSYYSSDGFVGSDSLNANKFGIYRRYFKRIMDFSIAIIAAPLAVILLAPFALVIAMDGHAPLYWQKRIGKNGRIYHMLKLRSMVPNADSLLSEYLAQNPEARREWDELQKLKDDPRITPLGKFIRKTSLDELPQLWNVIVGDMSLVGPRPIMCEQRTLYPGLDYYSMRPGITGYWQISDRNECSFAERALFDSDYYNELSFGNDFAVLTRTVRVVLKATGH